jgi:hypothetical protein
VVAVFASTARYGLAEWDTSFVNLITSIHKYHGYAVIAISQITVSLGMAFYLTSAGNRGLAIGFSVGNAVLFAGVIATFEIIKQRN